MSALVEERRGGRSVPRAWHLIERNLFVYRRTWTVIVSGFFEPLFYLLGIGYGLGRLVGDVTGPGGAPSPTRRSWRQRSSPPVR